MRSEGLKLSTRWHDYFSYGRHAAFRVGGRWCLGVEIRNREQQLVIMDWDVLSKVSHPAYDRINAFFRGQVSGFLEILFQPIHTQLVLVMVCGFRQPIRVRAASGLPA